MSCGQVKTDLCWQEKTAAFPWCQLHGNYCPILGSLSSDDGIDNENGNNAIGLDWQNNNSAHASRFIVHFFAFTARLRRKMPNFTSFSFFGGRGEGAWTQDNDLLFFFLNFDSLTEFSSRKNCQHLTNCTRWNKRDKVWSSANSLFKWRFRSRRLRCCLSSPFPYTYRLIIPRTKSYG